MRLCEIAPRSLTFVIIRAKGIVFLPVCINQKLDIFYTRVGHMCAILNLNYFTQCQFYVTARALTSVLPSAGGSHWIKLVPTSFLFSGFSPGLF